MTLSLLVTGCSRNLSKEKATEILMNEIYSKSGDCTWSAVSRRNENDLQFSTLKDDNESCAINLQKVGFISVGPCISMSGGMCFAKKVSPIAPAKEENDQISFPCGTFEGVKVTSVTTTENKAKAKINRSFRLEENIIKQISNCKIEKPNVGESEIERTFTRDDSGTWMLDK